MLKRNLHILDRLLRLLVGAICLYFGLYDTSYIQQQIIIVLISVFGAINLFAAGTGYCPLYGMTGLSTYKEKPETP